MGEQLTAHFNADEFACKCGKNCDAVSIDLDLVKKLEKVRVKCDFALKINSGVRCVEYNRKKKGKSKSAHIMGRGVDIHCVHSWNRWMIIFWAIRYGFKRIGIGSTFIHLDLDDALPEPRIWTY